MLREKGMKRWEGGRGKRKERKGEGKGREWDKRKEAEIEE